MDRGQGRTALAATLALALMVPGCASLDDTTPPDAGADSVTCVEGSLRCSGNKLQRCESEAHVTLKSCAATKVCSTSLKACVDCDPNLQHVCKSGDVHTCNSDGTFGARVKSCSKGMCQSGKCTDPCSVVEEKRSYIGCSYWPTITVNASLPRDFSFSLAVANPNDKEVTVTVATRTNTKLASATVAAKGLTTIKLPWITALKQTSAARGSVLVKDGAYHLTSSLPVTIYQFSPLNYKLPVECSIDKDPDPTDGQCNSHTNDASLLLPEHALGKAYTVVSRPTMTICRTGQPCSGSPGFVTVVGTKPGSTKVEVTFSADTLAGGGNVKSYAKGTKASFDLPQWTVLQILSDMPSCTPVKTTLGVGFCDLSKTTDLTGTQVVADQDVAVFVGHDCSFVPWDIWACDHLEEQLYPTVAWGKHYIGTHTLSSVKDPSVYRVVSAADNNTITFNPKKVSPPVTLNKGEFAELSTTENFEATGKGAFLMTQFMVGQGYSNPTPLTGAPGDPSMALGVPTEQYRQDYRFLAPDSFVQNYVNIVKPDNSTVKLDGTVIDDTQFTAIGTIDFSGWFVAKIKISGGVHTVEATKASGISVYGVAPYTSYMYPGGLDLKELIQ
jgi:hypothetical protein